MMKKIYFGFMMVILAVVLVLEGCSIPINGLSVDDIIDIVTGGDTDVVPTLPEDLKNFIVENIEEGKLALNPAEFTSRGALTGFEQMTLVKYGYYGDITEGQWHSGQWLDGEWVHGEFVTGEWVVGNKVEKTIIDNLNYDASVSIKYGSDTFLKTFDLFDNKGSFKLTDVSAGGDKKIRMALTLNDYIDGIVTVKITTETMGSSAFTGLYAPDGSIGGTIPEFLVKANEGNIRFEISIESFTGTYGYTVTAYGEPLFIVDELVYILEGLTINGNEYELFNEAAIFELITDADIMFKSGGIYIAGDADFYELTDERIFLFGEGADRVFESANGFHFIGDGAAFIEIEDFILILNPESDFHEIADGTEEFSYDVDDPDKPVYALVSGMDFDLEIEFENEPVKIGTGAVVLVGEDLLKVTYTFNPLFSLLLESYDNWSLNCNGEAVIDNEIALVYEKNTIIVLDTEFIFETADDEIEE